MTTIRDRLRSLPSIVGNPPGFDPSTAPGSPGDLLIAWLDVAIDAGVPEPHAVTLTTVDADGHPDARVLILKDIRPDSSVEFSTSAESAKGEQLALNQACAISLYWPQLARAVRIRGIAERATAEDSAADFLARGTSARVVALAGAQSSIQPDFDEVERRMREAKDRVTRDPDTVDPRWVLWRAVPTTVEFWQGARDRNHLRLRYRRSETGWSRSELWP